MAMFADTAHPGLSALPCCGPQHRGPVVPVLPAERFSNLHVYHGHSEDLLGCGVSVPESLTQ